MVLNDIFKILWTREIPFFAMLKVPKKHYVKALKYLHLVSNSMFKSW